MTIGTTTPITNFLSESYFNEQKAQYAEEHVVAHVTKIDNPTFSEQIFSEVCTPTSPIPSLPTTVTTSSSSSTSVCSRIQHRRTSRYVVRSAELHLHRDWTIGASCRSPSSSRTKILKLNVEPLNLAQKMFGRCDEVDERRACISS